MIEWEERRLMIAQIRIFHHGTMQGMVEIILQHRFQVTRSRGKKMMHLVTMSISVNQVHVCA